MLCGKCGAQVGDDFKFCPECGTPMPVVRKAAEKALNQGEEPLEKVKAEEDKKAKEAVEVKNNADHMIFQCEKTLGELGDKIDAGEKSSTSAKK